MLWLELEDQGGKSVGWVDGRGFSKPITSPFPYPDPHPEFHDVFETEFRSYFRFTIHRRIKPASEHNQGSE
jgi:hypothetical protein